MTEIAALAGSLLIGLGIGLVYFGGLWLTMRAVPDAKRPRLLTAASFMGRLGVAVFGFYLISGGGWQRPAAAVAGFILIRLVLARRWGLEQGSCPDSGN